jgi:hypothetical protein
MKYLVVTKDAGAANIIFSYIKDHNIRGFFDVVNKGKVEINNFTAQGKSIKNITLGKALVNLENKKYNSVLTGTSGDGDLEYFFTGIARVKGIQVANILDHWVNYSDRFIRYGERITPNEIWVCDDKALLKAANEFKNVCSIRRIDNKYIEDMIKDFDKVHSPEGILYLTEPNRDNKGAIETLKKEFPNDKLFVRKHPKDTDKYENEVQHMGDLRSSLMFADLVFGHDTMALHIADLAGIKTYTFLETKELNIPVGGIKNIKEII